MKGAGVGSKRSRGSRLNCAELRGIAGIQGLEMFNKVLDLYVILCVDAVPD